MRKFSLGWIAEKLLVETRVDQKTYEKRKEECLRCENMTEDRRCKLCGCYIEGKAIADTYHDPANWGKLTVSYCPALKWDEKLDKVFSNYYKKVKND